MDTRFGNKQRTVKVATDVDAVLAEAATSQTLLFLVGDSGTLAVGVGHPTHAVLLYNPKAGRPPMHALGDATTDSCELQPPLTLEAQRADALERVKPAVSRGALELEVGHRLDQDARGREMP